MAVFRKISAAGHPEKDLNACLRNAPEAKQMVGGNKIL